MVGADGSNERRLTFDALRDHDPYGSPDGSKIAWLSQTGANPDTSAIRTAGSDGSLTDEQWSRPSRCESWSARDVIVHLGSTNTFWALSISGGLAGSPTRFLATFDPVASPAELVAGSRDLPIGEVVERFVSSSEALTQQLESLADDSRRRSRSMPEGVA